MIGKNFAESNQPIEVYYSRKKPPKKQDELDLQDFALFQEEAEATFSAKKKKHCFHHDREDIIPQGSDEK